MQSYIMGTINQLINDKFKQYSEIISQQIKNIALKVE
jgi:hypothetical protein